MKDYLAAPGALVVGVMVALVLFGLMPVLTAKLMSLAFPKDDPRRPEMAAEVYGVPRWERPVWVGEQAGRLFLEAIPARAAARYRRVPRLPDQRWETQRWELQGFGGEADPQSHVRVGEIAFIKYEYGTNRSFSIWVSRVTSKWISGRVRDPGEYGRLRAGANVRVPIRALDFAATEEDLDGIATWLSESPEPN